MDFPTAVAYLASVDAQRGGVPAKDDGEAHQRVAEACGVVWEHANSNAAAAASTATTMETPPASATVTVLSDALARSDTNAVAAAMKLVRAVCRLSPTTGKSELTSQPDFITKLVAALEAYSSDVEVARHGCAAVANIANVRENVPALIAARAMDAVVAAALSTHVRDRETAANACAALSSLGFGVPDHSYLAAWERLATPILLDVFKYHADADDVSRFACRAVWALGQTPETARSIAKSQLAAAVVTSLETNSADGPMVEAALGAIDMLSATSPDDTRSVFLKANAPSAIAHALKSHAFVSATIAKLGCETLGNFAVGDDANAVVRAGGIEAIRDALEAQPNIPAVSQAGARALTTMATEAKAKNASAVMQRAGAALCASLLSNAENTDAALAGCQAIETLANTPENKTPLVKAGAGTALVEAIRCNVKTSAALAKAATAALWNLSLAKENVPDLKKQKAVDALQACVKAHPSDKQVQVCVGEALKLLA